VRVGPSPLEWLALWGCHIDGLEASVSLVDVVCDLHWTGREAFDTTHGRVGLEGAQTFSPSWSVRKPVAWMPLWWTKTAHARHISGTNSRNKC
jgi:hypothetical protein